jgi:uncharacterized membrane protein
MPDISAFCPGCGRSVIADEAADPDEVHVTDLRDRAVAAFAYVGLLPAVLFLVLPAFRANRFVRFHSWQAVLFTLAALVAGAVSRALFAIFAIVPGIGFMVAVLAAGLIALAVVFLWVVLVIKALQGRAYELPRLGQWAAALA